MQLYYSQGMVKIIKSSFVGSSVVDKNGAVRDYDGTLLQALVTIGVDPSD